MSSMLLGGGYDVSIYQRYMPIFWGVFENGVLLGVNSGHKTSMEEFRSRGLYVFPEYRKRGVGSQLLTRACSTAKEEKCKLIWSAPRIHSTAVYEKVGFILSKNQLGEDNGFEYGPNIYAKKLL